MSADIDRALSDSIAQTHLQDQVRSQQRVIEEMYRVIKVLTAEVAQLQADAAKRRWRFWPSRPAGPSLKDTEEMLLELSLRHKAARLLSRSKASDTAAG